MQRGGRSAFRRLTLLLAVVACYGGSAVAQHPPAARDTLRIATFNCSLSRSEAGQLVEDFRGGQNTQARQVASILRLVRPDIVLLNEFDFDHEHQAVDLFRSLYLEAESNDFAGTQPLRLPHDFTAPVNTGEPTGLDLNGDGQTDGPADAYGFGRFPGQYGMLLLSRYSIDAAASRTFQKLLWKDLPSPTIPIDPQTQQPWYPADVWVQLRLSSKSHWIVPVKIESSTINILASHPTPPAFDGPEHRNGCRNHDEIALLRHLVSGDSRRWLMDDNGKAGELPPTASFVICGDLNADPADGSSFNNPISRLLQHHRIQHTVPQSLGGLEAAKIQGRANTQHRGDSALDTADFSDRRVGNLRVDYCLPSADLDIRDSGVFWPERSDTQADLIQCSDHRLVWIDVTWPP